MNVPLLHRRDPRPLDPEHDAPRAAPDIPAEAPGARSLERLDRWIEGGDGSSASTPAVSREDRLLLAGRAQRLGKGALRMAEAAARKEAADKARSAAGRLARAGSARVARFFRSQGQREALLSLSRVPQRTLTNLGRTLPARVEAHVLEHTREMPGKILHTRFKEGASIREITELARTTVRSGAHPSSASRTTARWRSSSRRSFRRSSGPRASARCASSWTSRGS